MTNGRTQFYVQSGQRGAGLSPQLAAAIARQPGVRGATEVRQTNATVNAVANQNVEGVDPSAIGQFTDLGVTAGQVSALSAANAIMVSGAGWKLGQMLQVQFGAYGVYASTSCGLRAPWPSTGPSGRTSSTPKSGT